MESVGPPEGSLDGSSIVTFHPGASPTAGITGRGSSGLPSGVNHRAGSGVLFVKPAQVVMYRIEMAQLDPDPLKPNGVPCLVRRQGDYSYGGGGYVASDVGPRQIITENVTGFKVYLSADGGREWAGLDSAGSGDLKGWNGWNVGIRSQIDNQLAKVGRPGWQTTRGSEHWFRSIPVLVRIDVTTRTATKRTEFSKSAEPSADNPKAAYREMTQTLVFVPRHFGLPMD